MTDVLTLSNPVSVRARVPWLSLTLVLLLVLGTLANAAANLIPFHVPTARERQLEEQCAIAAARRARIAELLAAGDHCQAQLAREVARALVFDGRSARAYADDHERRCGDDPLVRIWANAPQPPARAPGSWIRLRGRASSCGTMDAWH